ncbi:MAG TPA: ABC-type transport auxiliary lipoprotein family protein [Burkholderiales bacterium]|nr:ABC-type transport auxiliary lipoprotein family protein [Burkholderiales bacterium]
MLRFFVLCLIAATAGCSINRPDAAQPVSYDLGPQPAYTRTNPALPGALLIPQVGAPPWLDEDQIIYRLLYEDGARPQSYSMSRWTAEPAALLTGRLRARFAAVSGGVVAPGYGARADYTLRVELEDFSQSFAQPGESRVTLRARASLLATRERKLIAQQVFDVQRRAAPNASGAVKGLTEATDAFVEALVAWTVQNAGREKVQ